MKKILLALLAAATGAHADLGDVLITEIAVTPTNGEFIEIHNSGATPVDLSDVYLTDATFSGGSVYYYKIVTGVLADAGGGGFADFHARFPDGAVIAAGEYQTVALTGSDDFFAQYGVNPTYELFEDSAADGIADMREALPGSINLQGGLTNDGEVMILYHWDGQSDLVQDMDYVLWGDRVEAVDKTGVAIDGPDAGSTTSSYLNDTATGSQAVVDTSGHAFGFTWQRVDLTEGTETGSGGNSVNGHDETSEDTNNTFAEATPTPNAGAGNPPTPFMIINEMDALSATAEFIELYDGGVGNTDTSGMILVLFDGASDTSYLTLDLNGLSTSVDGYLLIGSAATSPDLVIADGALQDGADAIALYDSAASNFPNGSAITTTDLLDAVVYDSGQADDAGLLALINGGQPQLNEDANGNAASESLARCPNGSGGQLNTATYNSATPTPGSINNLCPIGDYYASADPSNATTLRNSLHNIIDDHTSYPYSSGATDTWDVLSFADADPNDESLVWMVYKNNSYTWLGGGQQAYNREHTWPQSYGFSSGALGDDNTARTDMHHLMLSDVNYNSDRGNLYFDNCSAACTERATDVNQDINMTSVGGGSGVYPGNSNWFDGDSWEVWNFRKGDIARAMFYMDVRYAGDVAGEVDLQLTDNPAEIQTGQPKMGLLSVLLQWHIDDPVDANEIFRHERIYSFQGNRNPFIDHPEWVACVFSDVCTSDVIFAHGFE